MASKLFDNSLAEQKMSYLPKWVSSRAMGIYFSILVVASAMFMKYMLSWYWILAGVVSIVAFFYYGNQLSRSWSVERMRNSKRFVKKLFWTSFVIRVVYMTLIYVVFMATYGNPFGFEDMDATLYHGMGMFMAEQFKDGNFHVYDLATDYLGRADLSDMGQGVYLGFVYLISDNSIYLARLFKCLWSALTAVLIYRLAQRNFGEQVARLAGIFVMLWPNFWYYCGCHLKECEMVFLGVLFVEQADQMLRAKHFTVWKVIPLLAIAFAVFTYRTPLGFVCVMSLMFTITMASERVMNWGKRIIVGVLAASLLIVSMGDRLEREATEMYETVSSGSQQQNMEWRSRRKNGNTFAKYASTAVFAPLITTIPFPTMTDVPGQYVQKMNHGGNFVKNIMSAFLILILFQMLFSGDWRKYTFPLSFMLGYIVVLALSNFAQSERFHQPAMPFELMFAAYGLTYVLNSSRRGMYKRWFNYWTLFILVAGIGWQWFKLKGRGL